MKKLIAATICASMLASPILAISESNMYMSSKSDSEISETTQKLNQPTTTDMEAMIKLVKPKISVDSDCTQFEWNYNAGDYRNISSWHFTWKNEKNTKVTSIICDTDGNILSYGNYDRENFQYNAKLPKYKKLELLETAVSFIDKIAPDIKNSLKLEKIDCYSISSGKYEYIFSRYENDILFKDNYVTVQIDNATGKISSFSSNFFRNLEIPNKSEIISSDDAKEILKTKQKMVLSYRIKTETNKLDDPKDDTISAYLVYTPENEYVSVDAKTKEIYTETTEWTIKSSANDSTSPGEANKNESFENNSSEYELSDEELKELEILNKLISKESAIKAITDNKDLYLDESLSAVKATLQKGYNKFYYIRPTNNSDDYVWQISFTNPKPIENSNGKYYDYSSAFAIVDAKTAQVITFGASLPNYAYYEDKKLTYPEIKFDLDDSQKLAENFLKNQIPEKFKNSKISLVTPDNVVKFNVVGDVTEPVYGSYQYYYNRVNEGIDFPYNNINIAVDGVSGKIYHYNYNWFDEIKFESPEEAIGEDKAFEIYTSLNGFGLNYEAFNKYIFNEYKLSDKEYVDYDSLYQGETKVRLVYSDYAVSPDAIMALSGKQIDYNGDEFMPNTEYKYTDIENHWAKETIELFADVNVGYKSSEFIPDKAITEQEFCTLASQANLTFSIKEDEANKELTRIQSIKYLIDSLGYEKIAKLSDVFKVEFADKAEIPQELLGYVALAKGLNIANGDGTNFYPNKILTRAEALTLLKNSLEIR